MAETTAKTKTTKAADEVTLDADHPYMVALEQGYYGGGEDHDDTDYSVSAGGGPAAGEA